MRKFKRYPSSYVRANFVQLPQHSTAQELGFLQESFDTFLDDLGWASEVETTVDMDLLYEMLDQLYDDIANTRKIFDAAQYLATTSFVKRGKGVKTDNATKLAKAKELLRKIGMYFNDKEIIKVIDCYNKLFKDAYNAYTQFDDQLG